MRRLSSSIAVAIGLGFAALGALAWAQTAAAPPKAAAAKPAGKAHRKAAPAGPLAIDDVNGAAIADADAHPGDWMSYGRSYDEQRFSPLKQINVSNAGQLGLAWYAELGSTRGVEATPLEIDGVVYDVLPWNITKAYDARTGKLLWSYDPKVPLSTARLTCCDLDARGLAAWKGKIYVPTLDARLIALDAKTGKMLWTVNTLDDGQKAAITITGAPRVFDGKVVIGNAGGESAARGYVTAYDAETGAKDWRFYIVPGDPAKGQTKGDKIAAKTWTGEWWRNGGGGNDWDTLVYDPKLKLVYIGTGNGAPWYAEFRNPQPGGDNLFTSSIVAIHVENGEYAWHYQEVPNEEWDYDATAPLMLADLKIAGKTRKVIMHAPKTGFFYVLDRATGKLISAEAYVNQNWADGIDMKTGRPRIKKDMFYGEKPILITPNAAHNWYPMAYSPLTGLIYFPVNETGRIIASDPNFKLKIGGLSQLGNALTGYEDVRKQLAEENKKNQNYYLIAYDPVKQKEVWRHRYTGPGNGGVLATAGNLVFEGNNGAAFAAFNAKTGETVWEMPVQQIPISPPITYSLDGVQYVALNAGYGGGLAHDNQNASNPTVPIYDYGRLLVFKLGGTVQLPKFTPVKATLDPPPRIPHSNGEMKAGFDLYNANCAACHGANAVGGIKDLRRMSAQTHSDFFDIVLNGKRASGGMPNFGDKLSHADVELIQKYLIGRIEEDWVDLKAGG